MGILPLLLIYFILVLVELSPRASFGHVLLSECVALQDLHGLLQPYLEATPTVEFVCQDSEILETGGPCKVRHIANPPLFVALLTLIELFHLPPNYNDRSIIVYMYI